MPALRPAELGDVTFSPGPGMYITTTPFDRNSNTPPVKSSHNINHPTPLFLSST